MSRRFQFSLKWLLSAPALCGIVAAAFVAKDWWVQTLLLHLVPIMTFGSVVAMLFSRGRYMAAFACGGVFPAFIGAVLAVKPLFGGRSYDNGDGSLADLVLSLLGDGNPLLDDEFKFRVAFLLAATLLGGFAGISIRLLDSHKDEK
jgi:hypothetical protein